MLSLEYWEISPFVYLTHSCVIKCFFSGWTGSILAVYASFCVWVWLAVCPPTDCRSSSSHYFLLGLLTLVHMNCKPLRVGRHESSSALCSPDSFFFFFLCKLSLQTDKGDVRSCEWLLMARVLIFLYSAFLFPFVFLFHFFVFISAQCEQSLWVQMWQVCVHVWKCISLLFLRSWKSRVRTPVFELDWTPQVSGLLMLPQAVHSRHANTEIKSNNQSLFACFQVDVYEDLIF